MKMESLKANMHRPKITAADYSSDHLIRRNLRALYVPALMRAYLRTRAQHLASFITVERPRKAKIRLR
jgi:hypothetical protein